MKKKFTARKIVIACVLCVIACTSTQAKDIYLSPSGSDKNDGLSQDKPLATISRAYTIAETNDIIHVTGFIDMTKEPKSSIGSNDLLMEGTNELTVDGVVYNTWNAANGTNGVKPLAKVVTVIGDNKNTCGFDGKLMTRLFKLDRRAEATELGQGPFIFKNLTFKRGNSDGSGDSGGAFYLRNVASTTFENCIFDSNYGTSNGNSIRGGAFFITLEDGAKIAFKDCDFTNNEAPQGNAIYATSGIMDITNCTFGDNWNEFTENSKGGVFYFFPNEGNSIIANIENCKFINNTTAQYGGVMFYRDGGNTNPKEAKITFKDCLMTENAAHQDNGEGGVFYLDNSNGYVKMTFSVINSTIYNNEATQSGGVLLIDNAQEGAVLNIVNSTITENRCEGPNAVNAGSSGGFRFRGADTQMSLPLKKNIYNSIIEGNYTVTEEGNIPSDITGQGPAHFIAEYNATLANSYVGFISCDEFDPSEFPDCVLGYGADKIAGLADDVEKYIEEYGCIPLKNDATTKTFGNAQFLKDLDIDTDQLGHVRPFIDNKCYIGSVEADEASINSGTGINNPKTNSNIFIHQSDNKLYVKGISSENTKIEIYNISGVCVKTISGNMIQDGYSLNELGAGFYVVKVGQNNKSLAQKILVP